MNYLAHLYLAEDTDESVLGNFLGDFVKGPIGNDYAPEILKGIRTHRKVDAFTDSHEKFKSGKRLMSPARRRFSGIIIDLAFDHFLARNWSSYSEEELDRFIRKVYGVFRRNAHLLPDSVKGMLPRMIEEDWLGSYRELEDTGRILDRISNRLRRRSGRENSLSGAVEEIESNYTALEENFSAFFPDVISFVENYRKTGFEHS